MLGWRGDLKIFAMWTDFWCKVFKKPERSLKRSILKFNRVHPEIYDVLLGLYTNMQKNYFLGTEFSKKIDRMGFELLRKGRKVKKNRFFQITFSRKIFF